MSLRLLLVALLAACCAVPASGETQLERHLHEIDWSHYQDLTVQLLQDYIRIDTSNPPGNEIAAAEFFHHLFDEYGIQNTVFTYAPDRADIYAILKGDGSERPIVLLNHMDVVLADPQSWKVPPFSGEIVDGVLYGRGAMDMKDLGLMQAMVMLIAAREHLPLKRDLIFLATADEEVDDSGSAWFIAHHADLMEHAEYLLTEGGSTVTYPGKGTLYGIGVAEKAPDWIRMTATGRGGHGSIPIAHSAPDRLVDAMYRVVHWQAPIRLLPPVEKYFHEIAALEPGPRADRFRNIRESLKDPKFLELVTADPDFNYLLRDTVSLTVMHGSPQTNVIPDTAYCDLDVRLLPGEDPEEFMSELRNVVHDSSIKMEPIGVFRAPNSSPTDTALYRLIEGVVQERHPGAVVAPTLDSGYTESQMYRPLGVVAYGFSPVEVSPEVDETEHAPNERIPVDSLRRGVEVLFEVVAKAASQ